jgi:hypothetical protein
VGAHTTLGHVMASLSDHRVSAGVVLKEGKAKLVTL